MIHLLKPETGQLHVPANTEILISFQDISDPDDVTVRIDGQTAIQDGQTQPGWETTRRSFDHGCGRWGLRAKGGLPARDILVQAHIKGEWSQNQRFFVKGAQSHHPEGEPSEVIEKTWHPAGWFFVADGRWKTPFGRIEAETFRGQPVLYAGEQFSVYWPSHGILQVSDGKAPPVTYTYPPVSRGADVAVDGELVVAADEDGVHTLRPDRQTTWGFQADTVAIDNGFIHARLGQTSFHLPVDYQPAPGEDDLESWYFVGQPESDGQMAFEAGMCLWWSDDRMIVKHDFSPITRQSADVLWTSDDIGTSFEQVRIIDGSHVVVNETMLLNTRHPEIQPV